MRGLIFVGVLCQLIVGLSAKNVCRTDSCLYYAKMLRQSMNKTAKPCDDFHQFMCGRFKHEIPENHEGWNTFDDMKLLLAQHLDEILNDDADTSNSTRAFRKFKKVYHNCMDLDAIEKDGVKPILSHLEKSGGWPIMEPLDKWTSDGLSLSKIMEYHASELGLVPLLHITPNPDLENASITRLSIEASFESAFQKIMKYRERSDPPVLQFEKLLVKVVQVFAKAAGNTVKVEDVKKDITDMMDFGEKMTKIIKNAPYSFLVGELMTINELQSWYNDVSTSEKTKITWPCFLRNWLKHTGISLSNDSSVLVNKAPIEQVVQLLERTPVRTIVNYVQWFFLRHVLKAGPRELRDIAEEVVTLKREEHVKWEKQCIEKVSKHHAVSHQFVKHRFPSYKISKANQVISDIILAFNKILTKTSWLKSIERKFTYEKLKAMIRLIGHPEWYEDESRIEDYYNQLEIKDSYADNVIELIRFQYSLLLKALVTTQGRHEFVMAPTELNAFYILQANAIIFPAAILQRPVLGDTVPIIFQYAIFGDIAGHEISHAFDPAGVKFDKDGNYHELWSQETKDTFKSKVKCFQNQYNQYVIYKDENTTKKLVGFNSQDENIADSHGLTAAYEAYQLRKKNEDVQLRLPGLEEYSDIQLFFMSYASFWCSTETVDFLKGKAGTSVHAIAKYRIIGVLSNMKQFSNAFNCPAESAMNPPDKCVIWGSR